MPSRRDMIKMTDEEQRQFLDDGWTIQIATNGHRGYPHLVAMWYVIIDGDVHFTTFRKSQKIMNLKRDPKITAMLEAGKQYQELRGLVIEGTGEVIDDLETTAGVMVKVGAKYSGAAATEEARQGAMQGQAPKRVTVRIRPENVVSWDHTKLGGVY